ncbi:MAG: helix-turn-helix domain-containing protein [Candidatus Binataceae bacterium]
MSGHSTISIRLVQEAVAAAFNLRRDELLSHDRTQRVAKARHLAMYLSRELAGIGANDHGGERIRNRGVSFPRIGLAFDRDHTSVMYACAEVERMRGCDAGFADLVAAVAREVRRRAAATDARGVAL